MVFLYIEKMNLKSRGGGWGEMIEMNNIYPVLSRYNNLCRSNVTERNQIQTTLKRFFSNLHFVDIVIFIFIQSFRKFIYYNLKFYVVGFRKFRLLFWITALTEYVIIYILSNLEIPSIRSHWRSYRVADLGGDDLDPDSTCENKININCP